MINKTGYACINMTLGKSITTNRGMTQKTLLAKGPDYASELALKNAQDLIKILAWNNSAGITMFRMSSCIIPWGNVLDIDQLKDIEQIRQALKEAGDYAKIRGHKLSFHPGPFTVIASTNDAVVHNSFRDLEMHAKIMDMMELEESPYNKINIHINTTTGGKQASMDRFIEAFAELPRNVRSRLTIENDDKPKQYTVEDLLYVSEACNIPIVFDYFHHSLNPGRQTEQQALAAAISTWPRGITPTVHYSESKRLHENNNKLNSRAHSDYIENLPETYGFDVDVMTECKMKELAILPHLKPVNIY